MAYKTEDHVAVLRELLARLTEECAKFHVPGCQSVEKLIFVGNCCQVNDAALAALPGNRAEAREADLRAQGFEDVRPPDAVGALLGLTSREDHTAVEALAGIPPVPLAVPQRHFHIIGGATGEVIGCLDAPTPEEALADVQQDEPTATVREVAREECPVCQEFEEDDH